MAGGASVSGREFSAELLKRLNAEMGADPGMSRSELSRHVCDWLHWKGPDGKPKQIGKKLTRHKRPIEQKESAKWLRSFKAAPTVKAACPATKVVSVGDREADIYELFALALVEPKGAELLVRAEHGRLVQDGHGRLLAYMHRQPPTTERVVEISRTNPKHSGSDGTASAPT